MNDKSKTKHKRYDEAFKRQAVEHWMVSGQSGRQIAAELGIDEQSLKVWKQKFKQLPAGGVAPTLDALQAENVLADGFMASPAVSGKALFLRTKTHLYRIEQ